MNPPRHSTTFPSAERRAGALLASGVAWASLVMAPRPARADVVLDWNETALAVTAAAAFDPPRESRSLAIVHAAIFEAVNAITDDFEPYLTERASARITVDGASPEAAALAAAHRALVSLYPTQRSALDLAYERSHAALDSDPGRAAGLALGEEVAERLLAVRASDGADRADGPARVVAPPSGPGPSSDWLPTPPGYRAALDPGWGAVRPFVLARGSQFRPGPPPLPGEPRARRDFAESRALGAVDSTLRTRAQTELARLWAATGPQNWSPIVRQLAVARALTLSQNARLFALFNLAGADAFIAAWDAKFTWNQRRPVTAIRAARDGDPGWTPLLATPPFPDYIAGHTTYGGAAERVLTHLFGARPGVALRLRSSGVPGVERVYFTFARLSEDIVGARVWGGVHWRTSSVRGRAVGQRVGDYTVVHALRPKARRPANATPPP